MDVFLIFIYIATILIIGCHPFINKFKKRKITFPCNVIEEFKEEQKLKLVGDSKWQNSCPYNRHIQAVYADIPTEPFTKAKCCGDDVDSALSWEIEDMTFLGGGASAANVTWNAQCEQFSLITGFKFAVSKNNLRSLSSIRCSVLRNKVTDRRNCTVLDLSSTVKNTVGYNETWQHECPTGYGLVGVYSRSDFKRNEKVKCCQITDANFHLGDTINFDKNTGGFTSSDIGGIMFHRNGNGFFEARNIGSSNDLKYARLISAGMTTNEPFCLEITSVSIGKNITLIVYRNNNSSFQKIEEFKLRHSRQNVQYAFLKKDDVANRTSQIVLDVRIWKGMFYLRKVKLLNESSCKADRCRPPNIGCDKNQACEPVGGNLKCQCSKGYLQDDLGTCISKNSTFVTCPTSGTQKGNRETEMTNQPLFTTETVKVTTYVNRVTKEENTKKEKIILTPSVPPWVYSVAGGAGGIIFVAIILGGCLCYRRTLEVKHRRMSTFEQEMAVINNTSDRQLLSKQYSIESFVTLRDSTNTIYRPFMPNIGNVEKLSPLSHTGSFISTSGQTRVIDPSTGEPVYTRINRALTVECPETIEEQPSVNRTYKELEREKDEVVNMDFHSRRPSCMTLLHPEYGDSDSDEYEENTVKRFFIPGDDEEELLDELNELSPDSLQISTKILGQGAFGLVKHGRLLSVNGTHDVAVKILKQRSGLEITQTDRVKFYQEAAIMSQFDHHNVITLFGVAVGKKPSMVLEYLPRGNLWKYLNKVRRIRRREGVTEINRELHSMFLKMARDIVAGMEYLAGLQFVHRDLAARNILLNSSLTCKIADFGLSRHFLKDEHYYTSQGGQIPVKWTAPEALQFKKYSTKSDVWSYGIVLWEVWSLGLQPYETWVNDKVMKEVCEKAYRLPAPAEVPRLIYRLMIDCWHPDYKHRPTFSQLQFCLNHKDDRILGKGSENKLQRTRSVTFSNIDDEINSIDNSFDDLQNTYCKTE